MKKTKYYYNTSSLRYEEVAENWKTKVIRLFGFLCAVVFAAGILMLLSFFFFDSPKERRLVREVDKLKLEYSNLNGTLSDMSQILSELQEKDDNIYRVIFEAEPIPTSIRKAGTGGGNRYKELEGFSNSELIVETAKQLDDIYQKIGIQSMSYEELSNRIKDKSRMLSSIPSIQPVANKDLKRFASGYGYRIHPIHKIRKFHRGVDFTAPTGTNIFATGDGKVIKISKSGRGYGHHIIVDHGYGYKSLYAHLSEIHVKKGQEVKRGEIIGYIGSTGLSTAPHLHYEVHYNDKAVNPINFFHQDLDEDEFQKVVEIANRSNQSFD